MQAKNLKQLKKLHSRNLDNLIYFCKKFEYYCEKRDIISLSRNCNKNKLAFVYRQIAYFDDKIRYCFENHDKILKQANAISDCEII